MLSGKALTFVASFSADDVVLWFSFFPSNQRSSNFSQTKILRKRKAKWFLNPRNSLGSSHTGLLVLPFLMDENDSASVSDACSTTNNLPDDEVMIPGSESEVCSVTTWYFSREEIEKNSPSRRHGISLKKETFLRKSYCTFLKDLGDRLRVPPKTIATAIVFCHRFFTRQSHSENDSLTIAKACMLLAGKVEEPLLKLKDIIIFSNEIIQKTELDAAQREEVYQQQKELVLRGELNVLSTLKCDLKVRHPYQPLAEAIKKHIVEARRDQFSELAESFVNDCLQTSLCLQYKPQHIAAHAFFHAAKHLSMNMLQAQREFDITFSQLDDIGEQMLEVDIWYFSREEIENNSPSRRDGIDIKTEAHLRESYCTFLKDLSVRLKLTEIPVDTAIVLCHRFFSRQSHAKNDYLTIATACMSLAAKVEYSQRDIKDVIFFSSEIIQKTRLDADQRQEIYEKQKELIMSAEELVLCTLNFDLTVHHPYKSLAKAIQRFKVEEANAQFYQLAKTFVNKCLQTTLPLQYKPHQIAAYGFLLASSHLKMDTQLLEHRKTLCKEFDVTRSLLKDMWDQVYKNESNESGNQNPDA